MSGRAWAVTLTAMYLLISTEAWADWGYAKWGMSVKEVVDASGGAALPISAQEKNGAKFSTDLFDPRLVSDTTIDAFKFHVVFYFHSSSGELSMIDMNLINREYYADVSSAVHRKYGKPISDSESQYHSRTTWQTDSNQVELSVIPGTPVARSVSLRYTPRISKDNAGL
ncbi:hypothetical protein [Azospirillum himalayense]|uniref:Uncharacterized protein n=1 Tax=Azospirillum himalayense TaxID=654847 RepID=A0ABW0GG20_9PROT